MAIVKIEKIILGIDPGTTIMGFRLIRLLERRWNLFR